APATIAIADSSVSQLRSGSLISAIFLTCALVTEPTFTRFGVPEPFSTPASFFSRTAAGGVLVMKVKDLSAKIVISTGRIVSWPCVRALNSLQKAMMLIPWGPRAVPTGGAGFALPAGICSLTNPATFFAIRLLVTSAGQIAPAILPLVFYVAVVGDGAPPARAPALSSP